MNENVVSKAIRQTNAVFTVRWSPLIEADIYTVAKYVPAMSGIMEIYFMDSSRVLNLLRREAVWYGGLRSRLRETVDPELEKDDLILKKLLTDADLYYRFTLCDSYKDMGDILSVMRKPPLPPKTIFENSKRYENIKVQHVSNDKIIDIE